MPSDGVTVITSFFEDMLDPRVDRAELHPLSGIILLTVIGMLAGADPSQRGVAEGAARLRQAG